MLHVNRETFWHFYLFELYLLILSNQLVICFGVLLSITNATIGIHREEKEKAFFLFQIFQIF